MLFYKGATPTEQVSATNHKFLTSMNVSCSRPIYWAGSSMNCKSYLSLPNKLDGYIKRANNQLFVIHYISFFNSG